MKRDSKLSRTKDQRLAVYRGLLEEIILREKLVTTDVKAKALKRQFDKLLTRAKKGRLADFRHVYSVVYTKVAGEKLIHELTKRLADFNSGYTKLIKLPTRKGDGAKMTEISIRDFRQDSTAIELDSEKSKKPSSKKSVTSPSKTDTSIKSPTTTSSKSKNTGPEDTISSNNKGSK